MTARQLVKRYLRAAGWSQRRLAELCQIKPAGLHHVVSGRRPVSMDQALRLERGTKAAKATGLTSIEPLLARELLPPEDAALLPTGTG